MNEKLEEIVARMLEYRKSVLPLILQHTQFKLHHEIELLKGRGLDNDGVGHNAEEKAIIAECRGLAKLEANKKFPEGITAHDYASFCIGVRSDIEDMLEQTREVMFAKRRGEIAELLDADSGLDDEVSNKWREFRDELKPVIRAISFQAERQR